MIVYKITNKVNGMVYIGATKRKLSDRWKEHLKYSKKYPDRKLYKAINEFGKDSFLIEIIAEVDTFDELYKLETESIRKYNSVNNGYNTQSVSPQREDWEEYYTYLKSCMTDDVKHKISETMKAHIAKNGISDIHRQRLSESAMGNKNGEGNPSHSVACFCIGKYGRHEFRNYKEAGLWWYNTCKPFGENYSQATYQRKIIDCIDKGYCYFKRKKYKFDDIKWYRK